jgi:hypothetical protein
VTLDLIETGHRDETWQYEGRMTVNKMDGSILKPHVVGECWG